jgi:glycogen synthase
MKSREIAESMSWKKVAQDYFEMYKEIINKGDSM